MTEEDIRKLEVKYSETKIQHICVTWFRETFPNVGPLLFAEQADAPGSIVLRGALMVARIASIFTALRKYEGAIAGVADLILLFPRGGKSSLCIEMKTPHVKGKRAGTQSDEQKEWQALVEKYGSVYVVCHGLIEFINSICYYLKADPQPYINNVLRNYYKLI